MKNVGRELSMAWQFCLMFMLTATIIFAPDFAFAQDTPMGNVLCEVAWWLEGNAGKGLATIAVTIIGVGATLGKVSWGMAMIVGIGVAIIFGGGHIVAALGAGITAGVDDCVAGGPGGTWTF